jgi:hypothetical protein
MSTEKNESTKAIADFSKESYSKAIEATAKLQEQYFDNIKRAADYYLSMQKTMMEATSKMTAVSPDTLKSGFTSQAYRSVYDFWIKQFETLNKLMGVPLASPLKESFEATSSISENYMKGYEMYSKSYELWINLMKKNMELLSQNMIEMQQTMTETYKGMMPLFSISEEEKAKMFDWINQSIKKNIETTTTIINKQLETLTKMVEDVSSNVTKLAKTVKTTTT